LIAILGSTGSIGINALKVAREQKLEVEALSANRSVELLNKQIEEFRPKYVCIGDRKLKDKIEHSRVFVGEEGLLEMLEVCDSSIVLNALVGFSGLRPTIKTLELKKKLALANKESLVAAGAFIECSNIAPVDSEHFSISCLLDKKPKKIILTASGGAFRDRDIDSLESVKIEEALKHPNWSMGKKITIDSATMTNKLFELLEAKWLFEADSYDAVIEKSSKVHGLVQFYDGSMSAHISSSDMRLPIAHALIDDFNSSLLEEIDIFDLNPQFLPIDSRRYPIWEIKNELLQNPERGVIINAANDIAVELFLNQKISFLDISKIALQCYGRYMNTKISSLEDVFDIDMEIKNFLNKEYFDG
jgi:1-deoxy-D-xylulose-5-phosphate reductoisomerase